VAEESGQSDAQEHGGTTGAAMRLLADKGMGRGARLSRHDKENGKRIAEEPVEVEFDDVKINIGQKKS
jgi:hypothetical protein